MADPIDKAHFGKKIKETEFCLDTNATFCNHGSYGTVPIKVRQEQRKLQDEVDQDPDTWFRRKIKAKWLNSLQYICSFVGAKLENTVFVQNATTGINSVLKSLTFEKGDIILATKVTYNAVKLTCEHTATRNNADVVYVDIPFTSKVDICSAYEKVIKENRGIKLAVIDHITSPSATLLPVEDLVKLCHNNNILVLIDGAHAPGHIPINIESLQADFYTGDLYKWLFTARASAILWIHPHHHNIVTPLVTSHYYKKSLHDQFFKQGLRDDTAYLTTPEAIKFYNSLGGMKSISDYNCGLANEAASLLCIKWKSSRLHKTRLLEAPFMKTVYLPKINGYQATDEDAKRLMDDIFYRYGIKVVVVCISQCLICRISVQVYNVLEDYEKLAKAVCDMAGMDFSTEFNEKL